MLCLARSGRAFGEDLICDEVYHAFPREIAEIVHPLVFKAVHYIRPPLQWRGGMLVELFKGKGLQSVLTNYREAFSVPSYLENGI